MENKIKVCWAWDKLSLHPLKFHIQAKETNRTLRGSHRCKWHSSDFNRILCLAPVTSPEVALRGPGAKVWRKAGVWCVQNRGPASLVGEAASAQPGAAAGASFRLVG